MSTTKNEWQVRKNDGQLVPFDSQKLYDALSRSGAGAEHIKIIDRRVKEALYDGITTKRIYQLAYSILRKLSNRSAGRYKLKKALQQLGPSGYPFEHFIARLFEADGYEVKTGEIVQGKCVTHEVDVIAVKGKEIVMAECKFHRSEGTKSDVKVSLYVRSRFTDIYEKIKENPQNEGVVLRPMLITNTRFTEDASQFGKCSGMKLLSWDYPVGKGLKEWIDEAGLFPLTVLKSLTSKEIESLLGKGIVLCREITKQPGLLNQMGISEKRIQKIIEEAQALVE